ncbi:MAG: hypothetical protein AVDCRST_MAG83-534 [uncultured Arthrobacter sp.]|uniref:Uncharacterized protein n=1 Tax=uncultured Arthrobacter sp. TaxID=114050 RepID=A0A6J4HG26_9MICC|nr:MAG: hypothetical protein AVDCRST_MAG83-534 [uncultured Arthrobacter sp.]
MPRWLPGSESADKHQGPGENQQYGDCSTNNTTPIVLTADA